MNSSIAIFCYKLKEYANEGDSAVLYVRTQEEIQMEIALAQKAEKMRLELELIKKAKEFETSIKNDSIFENWYNQASDEEFITTKTQFTS